jgi:hypothetical protein
MFAQHAEGTLPCSQAFNNSGHDIDAQLKPCVANSLVYTAVQHNTLHTHTTKKHTTKQESETAALAMHLQLPAKQVPHTTACNRQAG